MKTYFAGLRILVTGASGYIATQLLDALKEVECTIIRLTSKRDLPLIKSSAVIENYSGDIGGRQVWESVLTGVDIVYHFAAQTSIYAAEENPCTDFKINVLPMQLMLDVCRKRSYNPTIIFSGTVTETGMTKEVPVNEDRWDEPITIYDLHKLMTENYLKYYSNQANVTGIILRLPNVYGPGPRSGSVDRGVLNTMIRKALQGETLTVYGEGRYIRDYIYIDDVVKAFLLAALNADKLKGKHFVLGSGEGHSIAEAINLAADRVAMHNGTRVAVKHIQPPPGLHAIEYRNFIADTRRYSVAAAWRPSYILRDGIDKTIESITKRGGNTK